MGKTPKQEKENLTPRKLKKKERKKNKAMS